MVPTAARRSPWSRTALVAVAAAAAAVGPAARPAAAATPEQITQMIDRATAAIYSTIGPDHNWELAPKRNPKAKAGEDETGGQWGGRTALMVYALIAAGEDVHSPKLAPAIEWLKHADLVGVYALGVRSQVWLLMPETPETRKLIGADADALAKGYNLAGKAKYLYGYYTNKRDINTVDHSASQFGVLGMWAAEQLRPESVSDTYWQQVDARWANDQDKASGGWFYRQGPSGGVAHGGTQASMTAAGVATLFITQDYVGPAQSARCNGNVTVPAIDNGLRYMATHLDDWAPAGATFVPGQGRPAWFSCYTLYGVERIGVASGLKYIGPTDWYQYGADWCLKTQAKGGWFASPADIDNTALAVLFLARGRAPILVNKVQYDDADGPNAGKPGHWDERNRDVANFVRWAGRISERDLSWQITNLRGTDADLHDAPFLYLAGNQALRLGAEQKQMLKRFCQQGGMIFFNADGGGGPAGTGSATAQNPFVASVVALARECFPDYEFRDLPATSPVYTEQFAPSRWKRPPTLRSLSNGVRELMVLLPDDPAKAWQLRQTLGAGKEEAYQSLQDLILYGTDKQPLRVKGIPYLVAADDKVKAERTIRIGRLKYAGNWDPEPGGWTRLSAVLHNSAKVDLDVRTVELGRGQLTPDLPVVHLTGTTPVRLPAAQQAELKAYVAAGGTLVVDVAGGPAGPSAAFQQSAETLLNTLYPKGLAAPLPPTDPIYARIDPAVGVRYRPYARAVLGHLNVPQVKAVTVANRPAVYYSREDLSGGLVGEDVDGIVGYDPATATNIMAGILLGLPAAK